MPNWFTDGEGKLLPGRAISVVGTTVFALATASWLYLGVHDPIEFPTDLTVTVVNRAAATLSWTQPRTLKSMPVEYNLIRAYAAPHRPACDKLQKRDAGTYYYTCIEATDAGAISCYNPDGGKPHRSCIYESSHPDAGSSLPDGGMPAIFNTDAMITFCWCDSRQSNRDAGIYGRANEKIPPGYPYAVFPCTVGAACEP